MRNGRFLKGLAKSGESGEVALEKLEAPTLKGLSVYLTECGDEVPQVIHFDGHGLYGQRCGNPECLRIHPGTKAKRCSNCGQSLPLPEGFLLLEDERGEPDYVSAVDFGTRLPKGVALVVLSACQSGMAVVGESMFSGLAQRLIDVRVPAVVAMQYVVRVDAASQFVEQFYRVLGQRQPITVAMREGRGWMRSHLNQWYRPVLYLRWQDNDGGQLFEIGQAEVQKSSLSVRQRLERDHSTEKLANLEKHDEVVADAQDKTGWIAPVAQQESPSEGLFEPDLPAFPIATVGVPQQSLEEFCFQTATLEFKRSELFRRQQWVVTKHRMQGRRLIEQLGENQRLEMVAIPSGTFLMGSPKNEANREKCEGLQHEVSVSPFFISRYPVTQAQWRFVAGLPYVKRELKPNPSRFRGDDRPVEQVSWYDAVEFCDRLSTYYRNRQYRLPSEAEWEYACRAGTTTPFHFGETLTTEVANYDGDYTYLDGPKGEYRRETTSVDAFDIANPFGLCDMHGNVLEWCADHYGSYEQTPTNGSAFITDNERASRVQRGGSWNYGPRNCRAARRYYFTPDFADYYIGFRVSCSALK